MRIIDANSGAELEVGDRWRNIHGLNRLLAVDERHFSAVATIENIDDDGRRQRLTVPLTVRRTHPSFLLQKVGFIPS